MDEQAQKRSLSRFRREFIKLCSSLVFMTFIEAFNADSSKPVGADTPLPNLDDDSSMKRYISDRRVIGVC